MRRFNRLWARSLITSRVKTMSSYSCFIPGLNSRNNINTTTKSKGICAEWVICFPSLFTQHRFASFHPFTKRDEDDLVQVIKTKPRHVLKHVRQQVWRSRKRELFFRNTVTHLMIILQEFLRKQLLDPAHASQIIEGVMGECVRYGQHDLAHLLFRAFLRFRKYGCVVSVNAVRYLFESYKANDSQELMTELAEEMKNDTSLRPLCIAAYLYGGNESEAIKLQNELSFDALSKDDFAALITGYDKLQNNEKLLSLSEAILRRELPQELDTSSLFLSLLEVFYRKDDETNFNVILERMLTHHVKLTPDIFAVLLRQKLRHAGSVNEVTQVESALRELGYEPDVTGNSIIITSYARLIHFGDKGTEELMLSKVDTLLSAIESRLDINSNGDNNINMNTEMNEDSSDISSAHIRAVIRGYGAAGKQESLKEAWSRIRHTSIAQDVRIYNELFRWFALMGNVKDILSLKTEMEEAGVQADAVTYSWILRALGKYYPHHVVQLYKEMQDRRVRFDIHLYTTLLGIFGDLDQFDKVESLLQEMYRKEASGTLQFTPVTFAVLIRLYGQDLHKSLELYDEAKQRNAHHHPHVLTSMLHVLSMHPAERDKLHHFLSELAGWSTDVYNVLLNMYGKENNRDKFNETLEKMKNDNVAMNDVTFGTLITVFARWGDAEAVNAVMQLLKEHEGEISPVFYSVLASSLHRMGDVNGVNNAWEDLLSSKLFPSTEVYNQFLTLYSRQHDLNKMQNVLNSMMKQIPPNPVTTTTILDILGKSGRVTEMESLFEDMKSTPDTSPTSVTFHQMMNIYAKAGDVHKMENLHREFLEKGYVNNAVTYNILMDGYGRAKNFQALEAMLHEREAQGIPADDLTYCIAISAYGKSRMIKEVKQLFDKLRKEHCESIISTSEEAVKVDEMITPTDLAQVQNDDHAKILTPKPNVLTKRVIWTFVDAFCRCGDEETMDDCVELLKAQNESHQLMINDCNGLIPYYCRMGEMDKVEELIQFMEAMVIIPPSTSPASSEQQQQEQQEVMNENNEGSASSKNEKGVLGYNVINSIARGYARAGRLDKSVEYLHKLRDRNWVPDASTALSLSTAFLKAGLHDQARQIIEWRRQYTEHMNAETDTIDSTSVEQITNTEPKEVEEEKNVAEDGVNSSNNAIDTSSSGASKMKEIIDTVESARTVDDDMQKELEETNVEEKDSISDNSSKATANSIADTFLHEEQDNEMLTKTQVAASAEDGKQEQQFEMEIKEQHQFEEVETSVDNANSDESDPSTVHNSSVISNFDESEHIVVNNDDVISKNNNNSINNVSESVSKSSAGSFGNTNEFISEWKGESDDGLGEQ